MYALTLDYESMNMILVLDIVSLVWSSTRVTLLLFLLLLLPPPFHSSDHCVLGLPRGSEAFLDLFPQFQEFYAGFGGPGCKYGLLLSQDAVVGEGNGECRWKSSRRMINIRT